MRDDLDDEQKQQLKIEDNRMKKKQSMITLMLMKKGR